MRNLTLNIKLFTIIFINCFNFYVLSAQVDTESLRKVDMKEGINQNLLTNIGLRKGNTEFFALSITYRLDTLSKKFHAYGVGNLSYQDNSKGVFQRSGFIHLRFIDFWTEHFSKEYYVQKQFDYFQRLKDRNLIGGSIRFSFNIFDSTQKIFHIYSGTGIMYENELLNISDNYSTNLIRSSSYLNISWIPSSNFNLSTVIYYQWDIFNSDDYRILNISSMNIKINKFLTFVFQFNYRFDNQPPISTLKKYDLDFRNGIKFEF